MKILQDELDKLASPALSKVGLQKAVQAGWIEVVKEEVTAVEAAAAEAAGKKAVAKKRVQRKAQSATDSVQAQLKKVQASGGALAPPGLSPRLRTVALWSRAWDDL